MPRQLMKLVFETSKRVWRQVKLTPSTTSHKLNFEQRATLQRKQVVLCGAFRDASANKEMFPKLISNFIICLQN